MINIFGKQTENVNISSLIGDVLKQNEKMDGVKKASYGALGKDTKYTSLAEKLSEDMVNNPKKYEDKK